jgi:RIO-like serine/threonine protein kinase
MKYLKRNRISWHFEDQDNISYILEQLLEDSDKRRSYFIIEHEGKVFFVKYFLEKGMIGTARNVLFPRGRREYVIGNKLLSFSINTPKPCGYGIGKTGSFVIQEYLKGHTYLSVYESATTKETLLDALAQFLALFRLHHIKHNDLHLENVLCVNQVLFVIDLHKTVIRKKQLSRSDEVSNLAHSLAMIYYTMTGDQKDRFFQIYGNIAIRTLLESTIASQWYLWIKKKRKRALRETSLLTVIGNRVYIRGEEDKGTGSPIDVIKVDKKVTVERREDHIRKTYSHRRRAKKAWQNAVILNYLGLTIIPQPYFIQYEYLWRRSFIAMEDLTGKGNELDRFLDKEYDSMDRVTRNSLVQRLAQFFVKLLEKGVIHVDLKACNIFVLSDHFVLLDLEDFSFHRLEEKDLERLLWQLHTSIPARILLQNRMMFFRHVTRVFPFSKREMFKRLRYKSKNARVVYEGISGLKIETLEWSQTNRPQS